MPRNLVLLLDGTNNEVKDNLTNILKLYRCLERHEEQLVYYHSGIGTVPLMSDWSPRLQRVWAGFGLATGWGLDRHILDAYRFLIDNYRDGDRIYLMGFSRGSYTARALAGLIHLLGLVEPEQSDLARYALKAFKRADSENDLKIAWQFRRVIGGRRVPIHFLGVWDTVASIIVPRSTPNGLPGLAHLPYTATNPSVRIFRQAAAIDEKRRMFRLYQWSVDQQFQPDPFAAASIAQDQQTVWFAGNHSDIGGGYAEQESQAAKDPLLWMAREGQAQGLVLRESMLGHIALGEPLADGAYHYVGPDAAAPVHNSLTPGWKILEYLPRRSKWRRWPQTGTPGGIYFPRGEPRMIEEGAALHRSVIDRMALGYAPVNLPRTFAVAETLPKP